MNFSILKQVFPTIYSHIIKDIPYIFLIHSTFEIYDIGEYLQLEITRLNTLTNIYLLDRNYNIKGTKNVY